MGLDFTEKAGYSSRQVAWAAFALAVGLLALIGYLGYRATKRLVASEQLISHSREIQTLLEDIRSDVLQASNARRGFVITGDDYELAGYLTAVRELPAKLDRLQASTADNPSQQKKVLALRAVVENELSFINDSINLRRNIHASQRRQKELTHQGSKLVSEVFAAISEMENEESRVLAQRRTQADVNYRHTIRVLSGASLMAILLIFINFYQLNRELRQREEAERLAQERLQLINAFFSSSTVGFAILDPEFRYQRVNDVLAQMAGLKPEDLLGKLLPALFVGQGQDLEKVLGEVIRSGAAVLDRAIAIRIAGESNELRHWMLACFPLRDSRGQITRVGFIALDMSAQHNAEAAYRTLSSRLLRLQDEERRRIAREMHDSLGQYLTALKINLEIASNAEPDKKAELLAEAASLAGNCLVETRTLSHLLHPPLLDEAGLSSAARWYVNGFAERSGIKVEFNLAENFGRLPLSVETAIFRVLQESLTNIHRHAHSPAAEIDLHLNGDRVNLAVRDFGSGIPEDVLQRFLRSGTTGVGLAGMRERIFELGGRLEIRRENPGTGVYASIPIGKMQSSGESAA